MMVKSGLEFILKLTFRVAAAQCKKICPVGLNWPGRLAGISEGAMYLQPSSISISFKIWPIFNELIYNPLPKNLENEV